MKKLMYLALALLALAGGALLASAGFDRPLPPDRGLTIGMNLSTLGFWTRELPFVDVFRTSMPWVTRNANRVPGGKNPWSTGVLDAVRLDRDGYPLALPVDVPGTEGPQGVATLMCREIEGRYPAGRYVCLYDGRGEVRLSFDAKEISRAPGRIELDVAPSPAGILLTIASSDPADHVRNIRVVMPGCEKTYRDKPFNPLFLDKLRPFRIIRFMDWQRTNDSIVTSWETRTLPTSCTQAGPGGVAVELMIALCRELGADPWFCLPHQADDGYLRNFARMARDGLPEGGRVYVEYSNEVWNAMFGQYKWVEEHDARKAAHARKYARFAGHAFGIWSAVFGKGQLVRVACGQQMSPRVIREALDALGPGGADAVSCSAYFGLGPEDYPVLENLGAGAGPGDVMYLLMGGLERNGVQGIRGHAEIAAGHGLDLLFYEGGQSLVTMPFGTPRPYMPALWKAQKTPQMYLACRAALREVRATHARAYVAYSFVTCASTRSGSWGHLEHLDQPLAEAPKYRALMDELGAGRP